MSFVHLHVHSYFSFEQGTADPAKLLRRCRELGMDAVAVTDYDGLYGAVRLLKHAAELGVKSIIGMEITLQEGLSDITVFSDAQQKYAKTIFGRYALIVEGRLQRLYPRSFAIVAEKVTPLTLK